MAKASTSTSPSSSSSSSCSWRKSNKSLMVYNEYDHIHLITESDMEAAQQLMELNEEENSSNNNNINDATLFKRKRRRSTWDSDEEEEKEERVKQRVCNNDDIIMAKIQEIFGNDFEVLRPKKQRRYRSLVNIYMTTRPLNAENGTRVRA